MTRPRSFGSGPLAALLRRELRLWPAVAVLGLFAGLLEGVGIGLFVPLVAVILSGGAMPPLPEPLAGLTDMFIAPSGPATAGILAAAIVLVLLLKAALQAANAMLLVKLDVSVSKALLDALGDSLSCSQFRDWLEGDRSRMLHSVSTDSWDAAEAVRAALGALPAVMALILFGALLVWLDAVLALAVVVCALPFAGAVWALSRRQRRLGEKLTVSNRTLGWRMLGLVEDQRAIRLFGAEASEAKRYREASGEVARAMRSVGRIEGLAGPLLELLLAGLLVLVIVAGMLLEREPTALAAFLLVLLRSFPFAAKLADARMIVSTRLAALREVDRQLRMSQQCKAQQADDAEFRIEGDIEFHGIGFAYRGREPALSDVSCLLPRGKATALVGPSGAGKSTFAALLARLIEPDTGSIRIGGRDIGFFPEASWRSRIAFAGQNAGLVGRTVRDAVAFSVPDAEDADIEAALRDAGADAFVVALPHGLDTPIGHDGIALSGGQRQRLALARALLRRPDLLILDEATNAIDAPSEEEIAELLRRKQRFHTALVIGHRAATIAACDHRIVLRDGIVVEEMDVEAGPQERPS